MTIESMQTRFSPGDPPQPHQQSAWAGDVGYTDRSLAADLARLRDTWRYVQSSRDRDAIFQYLTDVFELVAWWAFDKQASERARRAVAMIVQILQSDPKTDEVKGDTDYYFHRLENEPGKRGQANFDFVGVLKRHGVTK
jgi:hypothetical protein